MFNKGDQVICVDETPGLEYNNIYTVESSDSFYVEINGVNYHKSRFKKFENKFPKGQSVWSPDHGWGEVVSDVFVPELFIKVAFSGGYCSYFTYEGKTYYKSIYPSLFLDEVAPEDWPNPSAKPNPLNFILDQFLEVKFQNKEGWHRRQFGRYQNGSVWVFEEGKFSKNSRIMEKVVDFRLPRD